MVFRVSVGAALSTIDAMTDIYVIKTYYDTEGLRGHGNAMLIMISTNLFFQILVVFIQYAKKSWRVKLREALICLFFLRPAVDAFRVATNQEDDDLFGPPLQEAILNKVRIIITITQI